MNTTNRVTKSVTKVEIKMQSIDGWGKLNRREVGDFIMQADSEYEKDFGTKPQSDDAYYIRGDEEGLTATWEKED